LEQVFYQFDLEQERKWYKWKYKNYWQHRA
jgi:hypothetical protein